MAEPRTLTAAECDDLRARIEDGESVAEEWEWLALLNTIAALRAALAEARADTERMDYLESEEKLEDDFRAERRGWLNLIFRRNAPITRADIDAAARAARAVAGHQGDTTGE